VLVALGAILLASRRVSDSTRRVSCANNLRALSGLLVERMADRRGLPAPKIRLLPFLFASGMVRRGTEETFLCPLDPRRAELGSPALEEQFLSACDLGRIPTSYLERDRVRCPLEKGSRVHQVLLACPLHREGAVVAYDDGSVVFLDREALGIGPGDPVEFGPGAKAEALRVLRPTTDP
jgi:hypothetical protein